jgi:signal transduction histidine kinase
MIVADVVEGVASTLTPNAAKKGIRIDTFVDPALPAAVQGDPVRVRQVLFNLTGKAVKFSEKKDVAVRTTLARTDADGRLWVRFEVIDHGIGISE